jgi:SAM-dependent methyltransferase
MTDVTDRLAEQIAYYRARAPEYDEWWLRQGRYDRGPALNSGWFAEGTELVVALETFEPRGRILELACGTGIWTERLLPLAAELTALDASPEMLALNAARLRSDRVRYLVADLFDWKPDGQYDTVFFSFWLSHVPPERMASFWELVRSCLAPGGRVLFVDSRRDPASTAIDNTLPDAPTTTLRRRLNDGREFHVCKIFYDPQALTAQLHELGWHFVIRQTARYFIHGAGHP